ncbi:expressed unknown protein [Seminavis robusta]|uniref:Uncharacterized protein n=1 Tax=Seminavis robusta TaxID=568900 RepID=A0A9N8EUN7_9STRA|nr:expressed unknown protein [Seminavis robusta]|eukprot:Sro1932_g306170.1 n/a (133) ;mRNA; f:11624-12022
MAFLKFGPKRSKSTENAVSPKPRSRGPRRCSTSTTSGSGRSGMDMSTSTGSHSHSHSQSMGTSSRRSSAMGGSLRSSTSSTASRCSRAERESIKKGNLDPSDIIAMMEAQASMTGGEDKAAEIFELLKNRQS